MSDDRVREQPPSTAPVSHPSGAATWHPDGTAPPGLSSLTDPDETP